MKIRVPATSANLGPGFDSCGIAVAKYLEIEVGASTNEWQVTHDLGTSIPNDEHNLLIQTALSIVPSLTPHQIKMHSDIPLARGLGSSSSVIVAGIELANQLAKLELTNEEKLQFATEIEGHPDNVAPAIYGDFVVATSFEQSGKLETRVVHHSFPECEIIAYIPKTELLTKESREVLPVEFAYKEAVAASSIANVMVAAILSNDLTLAGELMSADRFHEPYRARLVPHLKDIRLLAQQKQAKAVYLSGAGPTVLILVEPNQSKQLVSELEQYANNSAEVVVTTIDREGVIVFD